MLVSKLTTHGGGLVVSMLAFYSDDPSSNPADAYIFFCKMLSEKNENKQKEAGVGPFFKQLYNFIPSKSTKTSNICFSLWHKYAHLLLCCVFVSLSHKQYLSLTHKQLGGNLYFFPMACLYLKAKKLKIARTTFRAFSQNERGQCSKNMRYDQQRCLVQSVYYVLSEFVLAKRRCQVEQVKNISSDYIN